MLLCVYTHTCKHVYTCIRACMYIYSHVRIQTAGTGALLAMLREMLSHVGTSATPFDRELLDDMLVSLPPSPPPSPSPLFSFLPVRLVFLSLPSCLFLLVSPWAPASLCLPLSRYASLCLAPPAPWRAGHTNTHDIQTLTQKVGARHARIPLPCLSYTTLIHNFPPHAPNTKTSCDFVARCMHVI